MEFPALSIRANGEDQGDIANDLTKGLESFLDFRFIEDVIVKICAPFDQFGAAKRNRLGIGQDFLLSFTDDGDDNFWDSSSDLDTANR
jgi:hypothetical protein